MNVAFAHVETNVSLKQAKLENGFYNIINGARISAGQTLSIINPATGQHLAAVPDVDRALLNKAINDARNVFSEWGAVPFKRRKAIFASLLNKIDDHADELCALLSAEQGGFLDQARWEIDLLTKGFGPALMQMELHEKEQDVQPIGHITKRYMPIDAGGAISLWNLPVILSFGKVLPALLAGDTVVLRPSPFTPLTVLRISEYIRELLPPGVFNVVTGGHDLWPWMTSHSGIDLIAFTRSTNIGKRVLEEIVSGVQPSTRSYEKILCNSRQRLRPSGQRTISLWNPMVYSKYEEHFVTVDGIQKMPVARFIEVVYGQPADISRGKQGYRWKLYFD